MENKDVKISLTSVILCIIIIFIIFTFTIVIIKLNNKIKTLENDNQELNNIITEELGNDFVEAYNYFDKIDDVVKNDNLKYNEDAVNNFSIEQIKDTIAKYIQLEDLNLESKESLLLNLDLTNRKRLLDYLDNDKVIAEEYLQSDIKFEDYKNEMLKYMTVECFKENFCEEIRSYNGILYYSTFIGDNPSSHKIVNIKKMKEKNTFYVELETSNDSEKEERYYIINSRDNKPIVEAEIIK